MNKYQEKFKSLTFEKAIKISDYYKGIKKLRLKPKHLKLKLKNLMMKIKKLGLKIKHLKLKLKGLMMKKKEFWIFLQK